MVIATMVPMVTIKRVFGQEVEYKNLPENFTVRKVDQDGKPLKGAIFEFKDAQGNLIDGIPREGEDGVIDYPITTGGKHTLKEKRLPKDMWRILKSIPFRLAFLSLFHKKVEGMFQTRLYY